MKDDETTEPITSPPNLTAPEEDLPEDTVQTPPPPLADSSGPHTLHIYNSP